MGRDPVSVWPSPSPRWYTLRVIPAVQDTAPQNQHASLSSRSPRCTDRLHLSVRTASWKHQKARPPCRWSGQLNIEASTSNRHSNRISASDWKCYISWDARMTEINFSFLIKRPFIFCNICQNSRLCSSRFTIAEAYLHVTAELNISILPLIFKYQSFEQVLYHCLRTLSASVRRYSFQQALISYFTVITSSVFNSHVTFRHVPTNEGYGIAIPVWTANMVVQ